MSKLLKTILHNIQGRTDGALYVYWLGTRAQLSVDLPVNASVPVK